MSQLDDDLREALERQAPPPGLADRVIARTRDLDLRRPGRRRRAWAWVLASAAALALSLAPLVYMRHVRAQQGERAREEALLALRVTADSLRDVQQRVTGAQDRNIELSLSRSDRHERQTP